MEQNGIHWLTARIKSLDLECRKNGKRKSYQRIASKCIHNYVNSVGNLDGVDYLDVKNFSAYWKLKRIYLLETCGATETQKLVGYILRNATLTPEMVRLIRYYTRWITDIELLCEFASNVKWCGREDYCTAEDLLKVAQSVLKDGVLSITDFDAFILIFIYDGLHFDTNVYRILEKAVRNSDCYDKNRKYFKHF